MAFKLHVPDGNDTRPKRRMIIKNSEVIKVGGFVTLEAGGVADVDAITEPIFGLVTAITTPDGRSLESAAVDPSEYDGTWSASTKQYTAAADNQTDKKIQAEYIPVREGDRFLGTLDAAKGTTTGSDLPGYYVALLTTDEALLDESTAATSKTNTQFLIVDPSPTDGDTDKVVVVCILRQEDV